MRTDLVELAHDDLEALAAGYGISLGLDMLGLGEIETVVDALMTLADLVASDKTSRSALEQETRCLLIEDSIAALSLKL